MTQLSEQGLREVLAELGRSQAVLKRRRSTLKVTLAGIESETAELDKVEAGLAVAIELLRTEAAARSRAAGEQQP